MEKRIQENCKTISKAEVCKVWNDNHLAIRLCVRIFSPRCPLSFYTIVWIWKRTKVIRSVHIVLFFLHMSNLFTYRLGLGALFVTSLVSLATVCFIILEQSSQIRALQKTLHFVCLRTVTDQIEDTDSTSEILNMSNFISSIILPLF